MEGDQQDVKKAMKSMSKSVSEDLPKQIEEITNKIVNKGATPADALGFNGHMIEGIYGQAYRLYNTGKYKDASQLFRLLIMLNPTEQKYTLGMAACFHMLKEYRNAAELYMISGMLDPNSPIPHYHASDCYIQVGDKASAIIALEMAIKRSGGKGEFKQLKDRAALTVESLRAELGKQKKL
jgi:type III secretion system low calcium response chaperone LcrH/SycD